MTNIYKANEKNIKTASELIKKGGVVVVPTDTLYGISADVFNIDAVTRVFEIKGRNFQNPMISHIADIKMLSEIAETNERILRIAQNFWPGPLTLLLNRIDNSKELDLVCANKRTITVRIPNQAVALKLLKLSETPLVSTSANLSGEPATKNAEEVFAQIGDKVDMILDDGPSPIGLASTILDMTANIPRILRQGSITLEEISLINS